MDAYETYIAQKHARENAERPTVVLEVVAAEPTPAPEFRERMMEFLKFVVFMVTMPVWMPLYFLWGLTAPLIDALFGTDHETLLNSGGPYRKNTAI